MSILKSGQVILPVETRLAQGYSNDEFVGELIMPRINVAKRYGQYLTFGKESRSRYNSKRGRGGETKYIDISTGLEEYAIKHSHHLAVAIDSEEDEQTVGVSQVNLASQARVTLQASLMLEREVEIADIVTDINNYHTDCRITVSSAWTTYSNDILGKIMEGREAVRAKIGRYPDTFICSPKTWNSIINNTAIIDRFKHTTAAVLTEDLIAPLFKVKKIIVGGAIDSTGGTDVDVWGTSFAALIAVGVPQGSGVLDPTMLSRGFGYTLQLNGYPKVVGYRNEDKNSDVIKVMEAFQPVQTDTSAGAFFNGTLGA